MLKVLQKLSQVSYMGKWVPGLKTKNAISKEGSMTMFRVGECPLDCGSVVLEISGTQAHSCIAEKSQGMLTLPCGHC